MNAVEALIPLAFFFSIALVWALYALTRHKERMTMIEKGLRAEDIRSLYERGTIRMNPLSSLKWGIVFLCIGVAVLLGMHMDYAYGMEEGVYPALIALFGGAGLILFYVIASRRRDKPPAA
jgi:hypothetical protein